MSSVSKSDFFERDEDLSLPLGNFGLLQRLYLAMLKA